MGVVFLNACSTALDNANAVGTNTSGTSGDNLGGTQDVDVAYFEVTVQDVPEVTVYTSIDGQRASACRYDPLTSASTYIKCIVDVDELDMFNNAFTLVNSAPGDVCKYRGFRSYYYSIAFIDTPPNYVSYVKDPDTNEVTASSVRYYYGVAPDNTVRLPAINGTTIRGLPPSMLVSAAEDVKCPYDYSTRYEDGKNCCKGQYTALEFDATVGGAPGNFLEAAQWGGDPANCFRGPGMEDSLPKASDGFPSYFYTQVLGRGFQDTYTIDSPNSKRDSQIYLANYFDPAVHPANSNSIAGETNVPTPVRPPWGGGFPFYRYDCLDENNEVVARIDVQFREWNTKTQILSATGDPDVRGVESSPFGAQCLNDFFDWEDFVPSSAAVDACRGSGMSLYTDANFVSGNFVLDTW